MNFNRILNKNINFMNLNIGAIRSKMEGLQLTLKEKNLGICSLNEKFLNPKT